MGTILARNMDDDCADRERNKRIVAELFLMYWINPNLSNR